MFCIKKQYYVGKSLSDESMVCWRVDKDSPSHPVMHTPITVQNEYL